jgi:hypothetical protein
VSNDDATITSRLKSRNAKWSELLYVTSGVNLEIDLKTATQSVFRERQVEEANSPHINSSPNYTGIHLLFRLHS